MSSNSEETREIHTMKLAVEGIKKDVELIRLALLGNPMSGEKGLVGEMKELRIKQEQQEMEIRLLKEERVRNSVYIKIIIWLLCIVGTGTLGFVINTALNKQPQFIQQRNDK